MEVFHDQAFQEPQCPHLQSTWPNTNFDVANGVDGLHAICEGEVRKGSPSFKYLVLR